MDELARRTVRISFVTMLAALVIFGITIGRGKPLEVALVAGGVGGLVMFVLIFLMMWRD